MGTHEMRVVVVGAGIAGLAVAAALARVGMGCRVVEQATELTEVGAGIQLAPNASLLLHRLGLARHLDRVAVRPAAIQMRRWNDSAVLMGIPLGAECERLYRAPYYAVHRAHLYQGLLDLLPRGVVRLGSRCVTAERRDREVVLHFADGSEIPADVVIAADGIHSVLRGLLITDEPRFSGQLVYRGLVPAARLPELVRRQTVTIWLGPGQHFVCYPVAGGELVSFAATTPADDWQVESWHANGTVDEVLGAYAGWHDEVLEVVRAARTVRKWALHDRDFVPRWSDRRLTLIGDAAHPMLPFGAQGAAQGIEDALALAACLRGADRDSVPAALARYEAVRKPRAEGVHEFIRANARNHHHADGSEQAERDSAMSDTWGLRSQEWLFGYDAELAVDELAQPA